GGDGAILHLAKIVKDPFFDGGLGPEKARLQSGVSIRRWDPSAGTDEVVWDPFQFLNPLTERTSAVNSDPAINSDQSSAFPCAGATMRVERGGHSNSLQEAATGVLLMAVRHLETQHQ